MMYQCFLYLFIHFCIAGDQTQNLLYVKCSSCESTLPGLSEEYDWVLNIDFDIQQLVICYLLVIFF